MARRLYTQTQREVFSKSIHEIRPWQYCSGALTPQSKRRSSRNSLKHGFYKQVFCEFRKNRRASEIIRVEGMCLRLIKASTMENLEHLNPIVSNILGSVMKIWQSTEEEAFNSSLMLELKYIFTLCESVIRYSTTNVTGKLNEQLKEQNEKLK